MFPEGDEGFDDVGRDYYDVEELDFMRFDGVSKNYQRVCDYCHYTSKYRRAAHNIR